jgi:predicted phage tail component-like protein
MRSKYVDVAGRDGSYDFSRSELQDRMIEIECAWIEPNVGDLRYRARKIAQWLYGTSRNSKDRLIFTDEPDLYYNAKLNNKIDLEQTITMGEFSLMFRCDPNAYSVELAKDAYNLDSPTILYRDLTANDEYVFTNIPNGHKITVNNFGTYEVAPTLIISNPNRNDLEISTWDDVNNTWIDRFFIKNFTSGVTALTVDMENFMCYRTTTGENKLDMTFGDWWKLNSGFNKIYVNGFGGQGSLTFSFNARFL